MAKRAPLLVRLHGALTRRDHKNAAPFFRGLLPEGVALAAVASFFEGAPPAFRWSHRVGNFSEQSWGDANERHQRR